MPHYAYRTQGGTGYVEAHGGAIDGGALTFFDESGAVFLAFAPSEWVKLEAITAEERERREAREDRRLQMISHSLGQTQAFASAARWVS